MPAEYLNILGVSGVDSMKCTRVSIRFECSYNSYLSHLVILAQTWEP